MLYVACLLLLVVPLHAEYDILTRYNFTRPEGERRFWLYSPTRYQAANSTSQHPLPLILFFHGFTDLCELQGYPSQFSIWAYVAEVHQYHIAVMCGTNPGPGWKSGYMANTTGQPDDVAYTRISLDMIKKAVHVRPGHVFAMGHSNGAMMSESPHSQDTVLASVGEHVTCHRRSPSSLALLFSVGCWRATLLISSMASRRMPALR